VVDAVPVHRAGGTSPLSSRRRDGGAFVSARKRQRRGVTRPSRPRAAGQAAVRPTRLQVLLREVNERIEELNGPGSRRVRTGSCASAATRTARRRSRSQPTPTSACAGSRLASSSSPATPCPQASASSSTPRATSWSKRSGPRPKRRSPATRAGGRPAGKRRRVRTTSMARDIELGGSFETTRATFHCAACGYGARRTHAPARCPMCGGRTWTQEAGPHTDFDLDLDPIARFNGEAEAMSTSSGA
jgi:hypothetical protein